MSLPGHTPHVAGFLSGALGLQINPLNKYFIFITVLHYNITSMTVIEFGYLDINLLTM